MRFNQALVFLRSLAVFGHDNFSAVSLKINAGLLACSAFRYVAQPPTQNYKALCVLAEFQVVSDCGRLCLVTYCALHGGDWRRYPIA